MRFFRRMFWAFLARIDLSRRGSIF